MTTTRRGQEQRSRFTPWVVVAAMAGVLVVNGLANGLPLFGRSTGEISARFPVLVTPAGFTFSIWGVIYAALVAFVVYQALPARRGAEGLEPSRWLFVASCVLNVAWLFAWHALLVPLAMVVMVMLLGTLVAWYVHTRSVPAGVGAWWCVRLPASLYLGWITVASIVNARVLAYDLGWRGGGTVEAVATAVVLVMLAALALVVVGRLGDPAFAAVIAWAAFGIAWASGDEPVVRTAAVAACVVVLGGIVVAVSRAAVRNPA